MSAHFFYRCWLAVTVIFLTAVPLWAQAEAAEETEPVWVISFAVVILFLVLTLLILLARPPKRSDSAFTFDELQAKKEEEMKKIKGGH